MQSNLASTKSALAAGIDFLLPAAAMARVPYWLAKWWPSLAPLERSLLPLAFWVALLVAVGFAVKRRGVDAARIALVAVGAFVAGVSIGA